MGHNTISTKDLTNALEHSEARMTSLESSCVRARVPFIPKHWSLDMNLLGRENDIIQVTFFSRGNSQRRFTAERCLPAVHLAAGVVSPSVIKGIPAAHCSIHHSNTSLVSPYSMPSQGSPSNSMWGLKSSGTYLRHLGTGIRLLHRSKRPWILILGQWLAHYVTTGKSLASLSLSFSIRIWGLSWGPCQIGHALWCLKSWMARSEACLCFILGPQSPHSPPYPSHF